MPAYAGYRTKHVDDSEQKKAEIKRLLIPALGIALLVGIVMGARHFMSQNKVDYTTLPGQDGEFQKIADRDGAYEAKEWLNANDQRGIVGFFWTRNKTNMAIDGWYKEGAKKVYAFGTAPMTAALAIELPDEPAKRKYFIDYAENWRREHERSKPPVTDVGQKYVMIRFL